MPNDTRIQPHEAPLAGSVMPLDDIKQMGRMEGETPSKEIVPDQGIPEAPPLPKTKETPLPHMRYLHEQSKGHPQLSLQSDKRSNRKLGRVNTSLAEGGDKNHTVPL
ncbi:MAG: hypothetical protein KGQ41_02360 [Alphaproteobacteria bacterium]|nr:hypothetical protein [Alphaproteobacteria bacterium]